MEANPIDRLVQAADLLQPSDPELAQWLAQAIDAHVRDGESLDRALGLSGNLGRSARFEVLRRERDRHLAEALAQLDGAYNRLASEITCFERRVWPAWRYRESPDPMWTSVRRCVFEAFRVGLRVPATVPGLLKALDENRTTRVPFAQADG